MIDYRHVCVSVHRMACVCDRMQTAVWHRPVKVSGRVFTGTRHGTLSLELQRFAAYTVVLIRTHKNLSSFTFAKCSYIYPMEYMIAVAVQGL